VLTQFYTQLIGVEQPPTWSFSVDDVYSNATRVVVGDDLVMPPFSEDVARAAVFSMKRVSAPGSDGFGDDRITDLERVNRAANCPPAQAC
jgi:hypothetical protein